jgi:GMP synthase-like glutamine amidotransferase
MRILVLQNDPISPAGAVAERLQARGAELEVRYALHGDALPASPNGYAGALILGGAMSANDDDKYPALAPMRQLLRDFHAADKPLLGICLGSQILARCFGGEVRRHSEFEFGHTPLQFTAKGRTDPLLAGLPNPQWIMQCHEDTFDVPAEGVTLMTGQACANQAFRVGRATYAFQCHFEATPAIIKNWVDLFGPNMDRRLGERAPALLTQLERDRQGRAAAQRAFADAVTDRWAALAR